MITDLLTARAHFKRLAALIAAVLLAGCSGEFWQEMGDAAIKGVECGSACASQCYRCNRIRDWDLREHCLAQCNIECERTAPECQ